MPPLRTESPVPRRTLLAGVTGLLAATAGCGGRLGSDSASGDQPDPTENGATADDTQESSDADSEAEQFDVRIEIPNHVVVIEEARARGVSENDITPESEIPNPLHDALLEARDGRFETDDPSRELLKAVDEMRQYGLAHQFEPYVRLDGQAYKFTPELPEFVVTAEPTEEYDPARTIAAEQMDAELDDFRQPLTIESSHDVRSEYRASVVAPAVEAFLDEYDYIEDPRNVVRLESEWHDPGPPYAITVRELTPEDRWGRPITTLDSLPEDVSGLLSKAVSDGFRSKAVPQPPITYRTDDVPLGNDALDGETLFRHEETVYRVSHIHSPRPDQTPITVEAEPVTDAPSKFTLTVEVTELPEGADAVTLSALGAAPSLLWFDAGDSVELLDSDINGTAEWETSEGRRWITNRERVRLSTTDEYPSSASATYTLPADATGRLEAWGGVGTRWPADAPDYDQQSGGFPFTVVATVPE